jgi:hypothetical protein
MTTSQSPQTAFILCSRNDGYKEKERFAIHLNILLETFDEVIYVDWNSESRSFLYEIIDDLPKTKRLKHFIISPEHHKLLTNNDPDVQSCCNVLAVNIALRRTTANWITIGTIDLIPPSKEDLDNFINKSNKNTFYTFSRREIEYDEVVKNKLNLKEYREYLNKTTLPRYYHAKVTPNDNYSIINCCGDFQLAHKDLWLNIRGLEENMLYSCFVDTNAQKKAVLNGFNLEAIYDVPIYHMSHTKNMMPQGGDLNTMHENTKGKVPKYNDPWDWVEWFEETQNDENWGFENIEIECEII